jgi:hypothetical protein
MSIPEMLDQLSDFQAQIDLLEIQKRELLDAVRVPAEVLAVQEASIQRKRSIDAEYQAKQTELSRQNQSRLATVVIPPEIQAAFEAIEQQRAEIEREFHQENAKAWGEAVRKKEQIDRDLTDGVAEVFAQVDIRKQEIAAEFAGKAETASEHIARLTAEIKTEVAKVGATVKGSHYQAVYVRGRVTWNTDMLDGMIAVLPQLEKARKVGAPSVTLRRI